MRYTIFITLFMFMISSCTAASVPDSPPPSSSNKTIDNRITITVFNGIKQTKIIKKNEPFRLNHDITDGLSGIVFFTKKGFNPEYRLFKSMDSSLEIKPVSLKKLKDPDWGILTGVAFSSVSGGKLREYRGISKVFGNESIDIRKDNHSYSAETDANGVFVIPLPSGEYGIRTKNKDFGTVSIEPGKTSIKNIMKGMRLVD